MYFRYIICNVMLETVTIFRFLRLHGHCVCVNYCCLKLDTEFDFNKIDLSFSQSSVRVVQLQRVRRGGVSPEKYLFHFSASLWPGSSGILRSRSASYPPLRELSPHFETPRVFALGLKSLVFSSPYSVISSALQRRQERNSCVKAEVHVRFSEHLFWNINQF